MQENEYLYAEVALLKKKNFDSDKKGGQFKKEIKNLNKMLSKYQVQMKAKLDALQAFGERLEVEQMMLTAVFLQVSSSKS